MALYRKSDLNLFKVSPQLKQKDLHRKFKMMLWPSLKPQRKVLTSWIKGFNRKEDIVTEFQKSFHSSFWEFYLHAVFKQLKFNVDYSFTTPDFVVTSPCPLIIEATTSNVKLNGRHESKRGFSDFRSMLDPPHLRKDFKRTMNEGIIRNASALLSKNLKFQSSYSKNEKLDTKAPYIIALGSYSQVNYGREYYYSIVALLYGFYYRPKANEYCIINEIKKGNSNIPLDVFSSPEYKNVSAVLFSCSVTFGKLTSLAISSGMKTGKDVLIVRHLYDKDFYQIQNVTAKNQESLTDGLFLLHNPNAKIKLSTEIFSKSDIIQVNLEDNFLVFSGGQSAAIAARLDTPKRLWSKSIKIRVMKETYVRFNSNKVL
ncbi:MAG: hypothetical protein HOP08_08520 [Cyclobacteriaceae bacterium]|nr:hypothetical protein [Cyclobacteriaceae bacterium]